MFLLLFKLLEQFFIGLSIRHLRIHCQGLIIGFDSGVEIPGMGQGIAAIVVTVGIVEIEKLIDSTLVVSGFVGSAAAPFRVFKQALGRCCVAVF